MASDAPDCRGLAAAFERAGHALANRANVYACILHVHRGGSVVVCGVAADENTQDPGAPVAASSLPFFESDSGSRLRESPSPAGCNSRASVPVEDTLGISNPGSAMPQRAAHVAHSVVLSTQGARGLVSSPPSPDAATSTQGAGASVSSPLWAQPLTQGARGLFSSPPSPDAATSTQGAGASVSSPLWAQPLTQGAGASVSSPLWAQPLTQRARGLFSPPPSPDAATSTLGAGGLFSPPPSPDAATSTQGAGASVSSPLWAQPLTQGAGASVSPPLWAQPLTQGAGASVSPPPLPPDAATSTQGAGASVSPRPPPDAATCTGQDSKKKTRDVDSDLRAALRERLLQRAMLTREHTLYEYFCDGRFFPCLIVGGEDAASDLKNGVRVYMGNKDYVVHFKPCERAQLVRSAYSCAVTRRNESLREVARRSGSTQADMVRLNRHIAGMTSSARFEAGVILRTLRR